ncbi:MAG TPA: hypothetical protein VIF62_33345, partial [Labilithrix sp.]
LADQYDDEMHSLDSPPGSTNGNPRIFFTAPTRAKPGEPLELHGRVMPRSAGPKAKVTNARMSIFENNKTEGGRTVAVVDGGTGLTFAAKGTAPGPGSYDVVFEAMVDGRLLRAERDLDVIP